MNWLDCRTDQWLPKCNRPRPRPEPCYSIAQVAGMFNVSKKVIYKWLSIDEPEEAVISPDDWFKLPGSGYIRIKEKAVLRLQKELN